MVSVEVDGDPAVLVGRLEEAGLTVRGDGRLVYVDVADEDAHDVVRDAVADLGLGLLRMERQRHRMTEIFTDGSADKGDVHV